MDQSNYMLALLIPGKKSLGKDFHVYMQPLIEDMLKLWHGVDTYDAVEDKDFTLHAAILWTINDYPALGTMSGRTTHGYFACVHCDEEPCSESLRNKIGFICHRRFLPADHPWRKNRSFDGRHENREQPRKFSADEVMARVDEVCYVPGKHPDKPRPRKRRRTVHEPVWHLKVSLYDLPYWSKLKLQYNLDVMHIEKNICENILSTLLNIPNKTKDTISARLDLEDRGIRKEVHLLDDSGSSSSKPRACYVLSPEAKKKFLQFLSNVKFPDGYASNISRYVNMKGGGSIHGLCWGVTRKIRMDPRTRVKEREFLACSSTQLESREGVILPADCTSSKKSESVYTCPRAPFYRETKGLLHTKNTLSLREYS
jgi:hypothetical protein